MASAVRETRGTLRGRLLAVVAALLVLLLAVAVSTLVVRLRVQSADDRVDKVLVPAQNTAAQLTQAYIDQATAERGFVLTGAPQFLTAYDNGVRLADDARGRLTSQLRGDAVGQLLITRVSEAGNRWLTESAEPEIAARRLGTLPQGQALTTQALQGEQLFGALRSRLTDLSGHVNRLVQLQVGRARHAQSLANWVALIAGTVAALVALVTVVAFRRSLSTPLGRLVREVQQVADGDLERDVQAAGPRELATLGRAVDRMRTRILADSAAATAAREQLAMYAEGDRIARDLHDVVIQRLFATGMRLESAAARHPELADDLRDAVDELDNCIRELRTVIFGLTAHQATGGLRERVVSLVRDSERSLGFAPQLRFDGPVDVLADDTIAEQLVPALGEMLSNVARHAQASAAEVRLEATTETLRLVVVDDGVGVPQHRRRGNGLGNLARRAEDLGGSCTVLTGERGGTVIEWIVPVGAPDPA